MDKEILLACRDAGLGYEGKAIWEHLDLQVQAATGCSTRRSKRPGP